MLRYLAGYPPALLDQVLALLAEGRLAESARRRYPEAHTVQTDRALYDFVGEINPATCATRRRWRTCSTT